VYVHAFSSGPEPPPPLSREQQIEKLRREVDSYQEALIDLQQRLNEARSRLGLISKIVRDRERTQRAPWVSWAAVRAALYAKPDSLGGVGPDLPIL
jgi:chromosome segregation ATPase